MRFVRVTVLALALVVFGAGCAVNVKHAPSVFTGDPSTGWQNIAPHIDAMSYLDASGVRAKIFRITSNTMQWHFVASSTPQTIASWSNDLPRAAVIVNGVYFTPEFQPAGFLSIDGKRIGKQAFDLERTGMLTLAPMPRLIDTSVERVDLASLADAGQSYPFLVRDGVSSVVSTSTLAARRTFIGLDRDQNVYIGVIPDDLVTLTSLSQLLGRTGIPWKDVLNLDGGPSTGIYVHGAAPEAINSDTPVPIVLVAEPSQK